MEYWMIGVLEKILPDTLHARPKRDSFCAALSIPKTLFSIPDHYSLRAVGSASRRPALHYSNNPGI